MIDDEAIDLMARMLKMDPLQRITAKEAIRHPFFKGINDRMQEE